MKKPVCGSLARIADFDERPYDVETVDQSEWETGDYVVGEVNGVPTELYRVEDCDGEMLASLPGDRVIGALGVRAATLEGVGSWMDVVQGKMHALTSAGLFGAFTSMSRFLPDPMSLNYVGHIRRDGVSVRMKDFALTSSSTGYDMPTLLLVGTSMNAGKSMTGKLVCQVLSAAGLNVIGTKLTGAGRYKDIMSFSHAGANEVYDFVDVGLPSTVVPEDEFRAAIRPLLAHINSRKPDIVVAEAGASPLEPYNGAAAIDELGDTICCTILCASDPYAVVGVQQAFNLTPDLVTGPATNTSAAIDLVKKLAGVPAMNILDPGAVHALRDFLAEKLGRSMDPPD